MLILHFVCSQHFILLICFTMLLCHREYDSSISIFCNSYPWLFPGGIGDLHDMERGSWNIREWANLDYFWRKCPGDILELWKKENSILIGRKQKHTALTNKYCDPEDDEDNEEESESSGMSDD